MEQFGQIASYVMEKLGQIASYVVIDKKIKFWYIHWYQAIGIHGGNQYLFHMYNHDGSSYIWHTLVHHHMGDLFIHIDGNALTHMHLPIWN